MDIVRLKCSMWGFVKIKKNMHVKSLGETKRFGDLLFWGNEKFGDLLFCDSHTILQNVGSNSL